jgi:hypothetical protein
LETDIQDPHLLRLKKKLLGAKPDNYGLVSVEDPKLIPLNISPAQIDRAITFLQTLMRSVHPEKTSSETQPLSFEVDGETVTLRLTEKTEATRHEPTEKEQANLQKWEAERERRQKRGDWWGGPDKPHIPEREHHPTGNLVLTIDEGHHWDGLRRKFSDGKKRRLESMVDAIIEAATILVAARKAKRIEDQRQAEEWAEQARRRKEYERQITLQEKRIEALDKQLARFSKAREVDLFVDEYLKRFQEADLPENCRLLMQWGRLYANFLRDKAAPAILDKILERYNLMDDNAEISKWTTIE